MMKYHKLKPASGLASSDYGEIARPLFEAVTGVKDKDLERACKSALKRAKKGELTDWKVERYSRDICPRKVLDGKVED